MIIGETVDWTPRGETTNVLRFAYSIPVEVVAADHIQDYIRASIICNLAEFSRKVFGFVVDCALGAEAFACGAFFGRSRSCKNSGSSSLRKLDGDRPNSAGAAMDKQRLAFFEAPLLE